MKESLFYSSEKTKQLAAMNEIPVGAWIRVKDGGVAFWRLGQFQSYDPDSAYPYQAGMDAIVNRDERSKWYFDAQLLTQEGAKQLELKQPFFRGQANKDAPIKEGEPCVVRNDAGERWYGPYFYLKSERNSTTPYHRVKQYLDDKVLTFRYAMPLSKKDFEYLQGQFDDSMFDNTSDAHPAWIRGYLFAKRVCRDAPHAGFSEEVGSEIKDLLIAIHARYYSEPDHK